MGPTNIALVKLFLAEQDLREAQTALDTATKDVRVQERRVNTLTEQHQAAQQALREAQAKAGNMELDLKSRDEHIEKLRTQQQNAKNNKEYQTLLLQISTLKADRNKVEDETMGLLEQAEKNHQQFKELSEQLSAEQTKLAEMKAQIQGSITELQQEIDARRPQRDEAASKVPAKALTTFEKLAEHHEGEAMAAIGKPDRRREEYVCMACHMDLVTDTYNKLHIRDEMLFCPSCRRLLYIPDDLPPEVAVHKKKVTKPKKASEISTTPGRQESAVDILNSMSPDVEPAESTETSESAEVVSEQSAESSTSASENNLEDSVAGQHNQPQSASPQH